MSVTRSISGRVLFATVASTVAAGVTVALVGLVIDDALAGGREDARLTEAASTLAAELTETGADPTWIAGDETRELAGTGIVVAVFEGTTRIAGDESVRRPSGASCADTARLRACEVEAGPWIAVAARASELRSEQRATFVLALLLAVALTAFASGIAARIVSRWSVSPLLALTERVRALDPSEVSSTQLGPASEVDEVEQLRAALARTIDELARSLGHARRFAGNAAHELRTPLTAIAGELELAAESVEKAEDVESIARARRTVGRLSRLIERLLALSRPRGDLAREDVEIGDVIEELVAELVPAQAARVRVLRTEPAPVSGDTTLLGAMISAGLENALKFSTGEVRLRVAQRDAAVVIEIEDDGPGIPGASRERVFEAFERGPRDRASTGHGLGLALLRHVATLHGGDARFVEGASSGACLRIELPKRTG